MRVSSDSQMAAVQPVLPHSKVEDSAHPKSHSEDSYEKATTDEWQRFLGAPQSAPWWKDLQLLIECLPESHVDQNARPLDDKTLSLLSELAKAAPHLLYL